MIETLESRLLFSVIKIHNQYEFDHLHRNNNDTILFQRGNKFYTKGLTEHHNGITFGAFGNGKDPTLIGKNCPIKYGTILNLKGKSITVKDIIFDDQDSSTRFTAIGVNGAGETVNHCEALKSLYNFTRVGNNGSHSLIENSYALQGLFAYFVYTDVKCHDIEIRKNYCRLSMYEHDMRINGHNVTVEENNLEQVREPSGTIKCSICIREGSDIIIKNNRLGLSVSIGPLRSVHRTLKNVVFKNNILVGLKLLQILRRGLSDLSIYNNVRVSK